MDSKLLRELMQSNQMVELYSNEDETATSAVGFIFDLNESQLILGYVDPDGKYDGYRVFNLDSFFLAAYDTMYTKKIQQLYNYHNQNHDNTEKYKNDNLFLKMLYYAKTAKKIVKIELFNSDDDFFDIVGFVENIEDGMLFVTQIDSEGNFDGKSIADLDNITFMTVDSSESRNREILYSLNN